MWTFTWWGQGHLLGLSVLCRMAIVLSSTGSIVHFVMQGNMNMHHMHPSYVWQTRFWGRMFVKVISGFERSTNMANATSATSFDLQLAKQNQKSLARMPGRTTTCISSVNGWIGKSTGVSEHYLSKCLRQSCGRADGFSGIVS